MLTCCNPAARPTHCGRVVPFRSLAFFLLAATLVLRTAIVASATPTDDQYFKIYSVIEQADAFAKGGQIEKAKSRYVQAEKDLRELKLLSPNYNPKLVTARLNYLADRISVLSRPATNAADDVSSNVGTAPTKKVVGAGLANVKLIDAGAEPRTVLRLKAVVGDVQKAKVVVKMKMGVIAPEMPSQMMTMPAMNLVATITTKSVSAEGEASFAVVIDEASVSSEPGAMKEMVDAMEKEFAAVKGLTLEGVTTPHLYTRKIEAKIPGQASAETKESMRAMEKAFANQEFILPEEAIGIGAKWQVKQKKKDEGMTVDEVIEHELVSIDGDSLVVKSTTKSSAANQKINNPIMPGSKVDLTKLTGSSKETATYRLGKLLPIKAESEEHTETVMALNAGAKKQTMTMKQEMTSTLETE